MSAKGIFRKKLFKSSFFSFFTNKLSLVILAIIVFFTSAVFTAFMYTKKTFNNSYNEVTATSKLHQYTLKEQYLTTADIDSRFQKSADGSERKYDLIISANASMNARKIFENLQADYPAYYQKFVNLKVLNGNDEASGVNRAGLSENELAKRTDVYFLNESIPVGQEGRVSSITEIKRTFREIMTQLVQSSYEQVLRDQLASNADLKNPLLLEEAKSIYISTGEQQYKFVSHFISQNWEDQPEYADGQVKNNQLKLYEGSGLIKGQTPNEVKNEVLRQISSYKDEDSLKQFIQDAFLNSDDTTSGTRIESLTKLQANLLLQQARSVFNRINKNYGTDASFGNAISAMEIDSKSLAKWMSSDYNEDSFWNCFYGSIIQNGILPTDQITGNDVPEEEVKKELKAFLASPVSEEVKKLYDSSWEQMKKKVYSLTEYKLESMEDKGYYVRYNNGNNQFITSLDASAFGAVVSPAYAAANNVHPMTADEFKVLTSNQQIMDDIISGNEAAIKNDLAPYMAKGEVIWTGTTPWFVQGVGTTADFMYPIISNDYPTPNASRQAILFLTQTGYRRAAFNFPNGKSENYLTITIDPTRMNYHPMVASQSLDTVEKVLSKVEEIAHDYTSWPKSEKIIQTFDSKDENVLLAPQRITFLQKINKVVTAISYATIALLISLTVFIMTMVVKKQINNRRKQLAILQASGYKKSAIALSMTSLALIVGIVPLVLGYVAGFYGQRLYTSIFVDYWTLPTHYQAFNVVHLVLFTVIPFVVIAIMAFGVSLWELKGRLVDALASGGDSKGKLATKMSVMFSGANAKVKLSAAFFLSNMTRMLMTVFTFAIAMIALVISINNIGKFQQAQNDTLKSIKYTYRTDLVSASQEGGDMARLTLDDIEQDANSLNEFTFDASNPDASHTNPFLSVPSRQALETYTLNGTTHDSFISKDGQYMKNRVVMKSLSDVKMGAYSEWDMIEPQLTDGDKININRQQIKFINKAGEVAGSNTPAWLTKDSSGIYSISEQNKAQLVSAANAQGDINLTPEYKTFIANGLKAAIKEYKDSKGTINNLPFFISYNSIITDNDSETYSYLNTKLSISDSENFKIRGVKEDTKYVNLSKDSINALKNYKVENNTYPIVINKYFAEKYKVSKGQVISGEILNSSDRYKETAKILKENADNLAKDSNTKVESKTYNGKDAKFAVVAIESTYDGDRTYTLQSLANKAKEISNVDAFDGVFSSNKNAIENKSLSIYAVSGAATIASKISYSDYVSPSSSAIKNWMIAKKDGTIGFQSPVNDYINGDTKQGLILTINGIYGEKLHQVAVDTINWNESTVYQFKSSLSLSSSVMYLIEGISIFIALLFVALISAMLISDNKKFISSLKVMGYKSKTISKIFMSSFIPALLIAVAISVPVSIIGLMVIKSAIMGFGHVLIPLHLVGWEIAAAAAILFIGFIIIFWMSSRELKHTSLKYAFGD